MFQILKLCKSILKTFSIIFIFLIIWSIIFDSGIETKEFPQLEEPKTITFKWEYQGLEYSITETFYKTVYDYYYTNPVKDCWYEEGNFEICVKKFTKEAEEDNTISKIASDIKILALENQLSDDELLELTVTFVQSIPYDDDKVELIESLPELYYDTPENKSEITKSLPRYSYEVLYDNEGICTGKSFLAASLIKELGYGVALFGYEETMDEMGHMVPAIKCPLEYSSYNSGYCYVEITEEKFKIGELPSMDSDTKMPKTRTLMNLFEERDNIKSNEIELGNAKIYKIAEGDSYQKIIKTAETIQKIEETEKELCESEKIIKLLKEEVDQLENKVESYNQQAETAYSRYEIFMDNASYNEYKKLYFQYKSTHEKYNSKFEECVKKIDKYNNLVDEFNALIENFYK